MTSAVVLSVDRPSTPISSHWEKRRAVMQSIASHSIPYRQSLGMITLAHDDNLDMLSPTSSSGEGSDVQ
jgi:hypothetical protein